MLHLLKIEWLKLKNYRAFWIILILYAVSIIGANGIVYFINDNVRHNAKGGIGNILPSLYAFPGTWQITTFTSAFLFLFPGLLLIMHCCNEFSYKTSRQNIIDGIARKEYISVKLLLTVILSAFASIVVFLTGLIWGFVATGSLAGFSTNLYYVFYFFVQTLVYSIVAVFIAHWVRRSGLAIGIYFAYSMILENIISNLLFWLLSRNNIAEYAQILPLQSSDSLIKIPGVEKVLTLPTLSDSTLLLISFGYAILFSWLTYRRFVRKDI
jgi:ABC-2 type transport system permease protein